MFKRHHAGAVWVVLYHRCSGVHLDHDENVQSECQPTLSPGSPILWEQWPRLERVQGRVLQSGVRLCAEERSRNI